jgi:tetratricopeptide (TPR) repeat protein
LEALLRKVEISESAGDPKEVAFAKADVAMVFAKQERYIEALARYDESNEINRAREYWYPGVTYNQMNRASILWRLGRYDEARSSLDEASALAVKGKGGMKAVLAEIQMILAEISLSQRQFIEAKRLSSQAIEQAGTLYRDVAIGARITRCTAQAYSGATRDARSTCEEALEMAKDTNEESLISDAMLALAQAMYSNGDFEDALKYALTVQERLYRSGEQESEWSAWLLAGQCAIQMKDPAMGRERLTRANNALTKLQEQWGAEAFDRYQKRPDIQFSHKQLSEALSAVP